MNLFEWSERYSVGVEHLDAQHQYLFTLGNNIATVKQDEVAKVIMNLYKYTRIHFEAEEKHMKIIGFPLLESHKKSHEYLILKLDHLSQNFKPSREKTEDLRQFVFDWLVNHIMDSDKKYFAFSTLPK